MESAFRDINDVFTTLHQILGNKRDLKPVKELFNLLSNDTFAMDFWVTAKQLYKKLSHNPANGADKIPRVIKDNKELKGLYAVLLLYSMNYSLNFNRQTRQYHDLVTPYQYRIFFQLLTRAVAVIGPYMRPPTELVLYRGEKGSYNVTYNDRVAWQQFVSTSLDMEVGFGFAGPQGPDQHRSMFYFSKTENNAVSVYLGPSSEYPDERELLIWPFETYKITNQPSNDFEVGDNGQVDEEFKKYKVQCNTHEHHHLERPTWIAVLSLRPRRRFCISV